MQQPSTDTTIYAYWQPGCTSCLRMKEFLARHGVPFISRNVLEDEEGVAELAALGLRTVPIVRRGTDWANGQVLRDVARVAGIPWRGATMLPVPEMCDRLVEIQTTAQRLFGQIPEEAIGRQLPRRPRPATGTTALQQLCASSPPTEETSSEPSALSWNRGNYRWFADRGQRR